MTAPAAIDGRARLAELQAEADRLPADLKAAQRSGDAAEWLRVQTRIEDMAELLRAAEAGVVACDLDNAAQDLDRQRVELDRLRKVAARADAEHRTAVAKVQPGSDPVALAEAETAVAKARVAAADARRDADEAAQDLAIAAVALEDLITRYAQLTGEDRTPESLRPLRRPTQRTLYLPHPETGEVHIFVRGDVLPLWGGLQAASNPSIWEPDDAPVTPSPAAPTAASEPLLGDYDEDDEP